LPTEQNEDGEDIVVGTTWKTATPMKKMMTTTMMTTTQLDIWLESSNFIRTTLSHSLFISNDVNNSMMNKTRHNGNGHRVMTLTDPLHHHHHHHHQRPFVAGGKQHDMQ
jgi:hypothetical protein